MGDINKPESIFPYGTGKPETCILRELIPYVDVLKEIVEEYKKYKKMKG